MYVVPNEITDFYKKIHSPENSNNQENESGGILSEEKTNTESIDNNSTLDPAFVTFLQKIAKNISTPSKPTATIVNENLQADSEDSMFKSFVGNLFDILKKEEKNKTDKVIKEAALSFIEKIKNSSLLSPEQQTTVDEINIQENTSVNEPVTDTSVTGEDEPVPPFEDISPIYSDVRNEYVNALKRNKKTEHKDNGDIKKIISEQVDEYIAKYIKQFPNYNFSSGGGGGDYAKDYSKGGTVGGDFNVTGTYLSGGVKLEDIFSNQSGTTQSLFFNENNSLLSITGGNVVSLSSLNTLTTSFQVKSVTQGLYTDGSVILAGTPLETIIKNMLTTLVYPVYSVPLLTVTYGSPVITTVWETGNTVPSFTITPAYIPRDGGSLLSYVYLRNNTVLSTGNTYLTNSFQINTTTTLQVSASYGAGPIKNDNLGNPYDITSIKAGSLANTLTLNTLYPYFYGKTSTQPTTLTIAQAISSGSATKVLADASGVVSITYNANAEYIWFAHYGSQTTKTKWYFTDFNSNYIGPNGFINSPVLQNMTSPESYWSNTQYKVYISRGQTTTSGALQYRNS